MFGHRLERDISSKIGLNKYSAKQPDPIVKRYPVTAQKKFHIMRVDNLLEPSDKIEMRTLEQKHTTSSSDIRKVCCHKESKRNLQVHIGEIDQELYPELTHFE